MINRRRAAALALAAPLASLPLRAFAQAPADMADVLRQRLAVKGVGLVSAQVGLDGSRFAAAGRVGGEGSAVPDEDTLFELGSITKTFTALLLADAVLRGELALDDPVESLLPGGRLLRDSAGLPIRLLDLATHRSGLPRAPRLRSRVYRPDPFGRYDADDLIAFVDGWEPQVERGSRYEYSNLGFGLLGWLLAQRAGTGYGELLRARVLAPLAIDAVLETAQAHGNPALARPHDADGAPAPFLDFGVLAGAGNLVGSARALARYAACALGLVPNRLGAAFDLCLRRHAEGSGAQMQIGLAWHIFPLGNRVVFNRNGDTPGASSALFLHPARKRAALVLGNARVPVDDLALHALDSRLPFNPVPRAASAPG